ncbi:MAG TPA: gephyrin-like molybdotransferase Glp [Thermoanaerobaculia bacterium]|nr:gephyrin-like molybdotransferase Glp [Thermoanaerobaculia bacterium]
MMTVAEALAAIGRLTPLGTEEIPLAEASERVLARAVRADVDWPPFETSAMDGYAVRLEDVRAPGTTLAEREGLVAAGDAPPPPIRPGQAVRVMTGAAMPENAEAVVPVEQVRREAGRVRLEVVPAAGAHLRRRGESIAAGTELLAAGRRLAASDIALAAMAGADPVAVFRRPRIAIAATGNELVPAGETPRAGQLRDSNGPMLAALCRERGWPAAARPRVADDHAGVARLFAEAGAHEDILMTSGGVSAGDLDLLPPAAQKAGFELLFHGVAMRPAKPVAVARRGATIWIGLPGNPVSTSVGFHLFAREIAGRLEGDARPGAPRVTAKLAAPIGAAGARESYRDAVWETSHGESRVTELRSAGSHDIGAHARANALIVQPAGSGALPAGAVVTCLLTRDLP